MTPFSAISTDFTCLISTGIKLPLLPPPIHPCFLILLFTIANQKIIRLYGVVNYLYHPPTLSFTQ